MRYVGQLDAPFPVNSNRRVSGSATMQGRYAQAMNHTGIGFYYWIGIYKYISNDFYIFTVLFS